jgi:hypothetical protein
VGAGPDPAEDPFRQATSEPRQKLAPRLITAPLRGLAAHAHSQFLRDWLQDLVRDYQADEVEDGYYIVLILSFCYLFLLIATTVALGVLTWLGHELGGNTGFLVVGSIMMAVAGPLMALLICFVLRSLVIRFRGDSRPRRVAGSLDLAAMAIGVVVGVAYWLTGG